MPTKRKSAAIRFLEKIGGGPLTIGKLLEAIRLGEEISQVEFAKSLGISKAHLCDIEKGRRGVSPERAVRWAEALGESAHQFIKLALQDSLNRAGLKFTVEVHAA